MKEYIAKTGGRYTYNDDLLNLQELAGSMTALFDSCSNFIISGCEITGGKVTPGFVWINGKVRRFEGSAVVSFPYYIYEKNHYETITYAGDVNKHGRCNYLTLGAQTIPDVKDEVTDELPGFIEIREDYAPRLIDKFIGKYAVLLDSPFPRQTISKELVLAGVLTAEKEVVSKASMSVLNTASGYELKVKVKETGDASIGTYLESILANELVVTTSGNFQLYRQGELIADFNRNGVKLEGIIANTADIGSVRIQSNNIYNPSNATDDGAVQINAYGYNDAKTKFRNFLVFDGKSSVPPLLGRREKWEGVAECPRIN